MPWTGWQRSTLVECSSGRSSVKSTIRELRPRSIPLKSAIGWPRRQPCSPTGPMTRGAPSSCVQILEEDPAHQASLEALERLYTRTEAWEDLNGLYHSQLGACDQCPGEGGDVVARSPRWPNNGWATSPGLSRPTDRFCSSCQTTIPAWRGWLELD